MKPSVLIWVIVVALLSACHHPVETVHAPSPQLSAIDSLMWTQPDSAFSLLLAFAESPEADSFDEFNAHYFQLLVSELLYKNDYEQTNRDELLKAVAYFDTIDNAFLDARAHYINGVGFYERDSVVEACEEYLKAVEVMEEQFDEKDLVGHKAQFIAYTYNRLGDVFEEHLLTEPAIEFYKQALIYCRREPTSKYGISVLLYRLGIQYDITEQKDSAVYYYNEALANIPDFDNYHYRDLMVSKNLFAYYNADCSPDSLIDSLKQMVALSADNGEKTTRWLTIGIVLFEEKQYDSSRVYLNAVFEQQDDNTSKIMAAEYLRNIYQMEGDSLNTQKYVTFLGGYTMSEIEKKTDVSRINDLFNDYMTQQQKKQAEIERKKAMRRDKEKIIPIAITIVLAISIVVKHRSEKLLRKQQKETARLLEETEQQHKADLKQRQAEARIELEERDKQYLKAIETEQQTHRIEKAAMSGRLKRKNQELRELKDQIRQLDSLTTETEIAASFNEEPICRLIVDRVNEGQFKSKIDYRIYKDSALSKQQLLDLRLAVDRHFRHFTTRLKKAYPKLTNSDLDYCCLYLLGLTDADIAALMQRTYNTVFERNRKIRKVFGSEKTLPLALMDIVNDFYSFD